MVARLKPLTLLLVCSLLWAVQGGSAEPSSGQILGGSKNSPVKIEVFSDFECPACRELYLGTIRQVLQEYSSKDKVCVIYHEFPLSSHKYSREAARYSAAAGRLGRQKLLPVLDSLFMDQAHWSQDGSIEKTVAKALPQEDFIKLKQIMADPSINAEVTKGVELGIQKKVTSTPTMFISYIGKQQKVEGLVTYLVMKQFLDSIVK